MIYFKINKVPIRHRGILAPMLDFSTLPFRLLCKDYKCGLTYTEMIHVSFINNQSGLLVNKDIFRSVKDDYPTSIQLVGDFTKRKEALSAVHLIDAHKNYKIIDLNFGCPSDKITVGNSGSALLKDISKVIPIIKEIKDTCKKPITVKTRLGYSKNEIDLISKELFKTGIDALAIHGRRTIDNYSILSDISSIKKINKTSPVPIIYNGDVTSHNLSRFDDFLGIMVGRGALGNPQIFSQIDNYSNNKPFSEPTLDDRLDSLMSFFKFCKQHPIMYPKLKIMVLAFFKGVSGASKIRDLISSCKSEDEILDVIKIIKKKQ